MSAEPLTPPRTKSFGDASPRDVLIPEEQPDFERRWRYALARAADSFDLAEVLEVLESGRRRAAITAHLGHAGYREMLARAERALRTGEPSPDSVPWEEIKELLAERLTGQAARTTSGEPGGSTLAR